MRPKCTNRRRMEIVGARKLHASILVLARLCLLLAVSADI
jgi:hypothetical protein